MVFVRFPFFVFFPLSLLALSSFVINATPTMSLASTFFFISAIFADSRFLVLIVLAFSFFAGSTFFQLFDELFFSFFSVFFGFFTALSFSG